MESDRYIHENDDFASRVIMLWKHWMGELVLQKNKPMSYD